ncbi:hypothetical protein [Arthrobacter sp. MMS18-M83]|uniref:hypothetical protein n=1 Tax=Arthrobacter sp. MMS18-M83 TaxID=2996261 RepID=UPI00227C29D2|nr:hypothetical protein [Arthrobacter sp. MMS18-M83]WAH98230.1 hypothetical protein OW521_04970 [Arthrobacter sp. MMS18-M83]
MAKSVTAPPRTPKAKPLKLTHAFEPLDCIAVKFRTIWHNPASRQAVSGLRAKQDRIPRNKDLWRDGTMRYVVVFR